MSTPQRNAPKNQNFEKVFNVEPTLKIQTTAVSQFEPDDESFSDSTPPIADLDHHGER